MYEGLPRERHDFPGAHVSHLIHQLLVFLGVPTLQLAPCDDWQPPEMGNS